MARTKGKKTDSRVIEPDYYKSELVDGTPVDVAGVIEAFFPQDAHLSQAMKYLGRAGSKEGAAYLEDIKKARWWLDRAIAYHES